MARWIAAIFIRVQITAYAVWNEALLVFEAILSVLLFVKHPPLDAVAAKE
ncbi:hypothetical protein [Geobacillus zalihae]|nr:hypothetical protein [Geobacillus zalihae]QNU26206.1 hypothetical protein IC806_08565 [Geobacillus zalihae]